MSDKIKERIKRISEPSVREYRMSRANFWRALNNAIRASRVALRQVRAANQAVGI